VGESLNVHKVRGTSSSFVCVSVFLDSLIIFTVMIISFMTSYCGAFVLVRGK